MVIGRVYKIVCDETDFGECYIGSTFDSLANRLGGHKSEYKKWKEGRKEAKTTSYKLFEKYGVGNCEIVLIKEYEVLDRRHLEVYETLWIYKLKTINKNNPVGGLLKRQQDQRWREENKEEIKLYMKEYYEENKEAFSLRNKDYRETHKEELKLYHKDYYEKNKGKMLSQQKVNGEKNKEVISLRNKDYRETHKEELKLYKKNYYETHKEELKLHTKDYYEKNREVISLKNKEKVMCQVCLCEVRRSDISAHYKSQKHVKNLLHYAPLEGG
jgi:hypothetical protein